MRNFKKVILSVICIVLVIVVGACKPNNSGITTDTTPVTNLTPVPQSVSLINQDVEIFAKTNYVKTFIVTSSMKEVMVEGKFQTADGRPGIQAYIMDEATYKEWLKTGNVRTKIYDSGLKTIAFIDQEIPGPGTYNLIFTNWDDPSFSSSQWVTINVDLKWIQE
jgi:hypothetical protein